MNFSELQALASDLGLNWNDIDMCLEGNINNYPVCIADLQDSREYLLTIFCNAPAKHPEIEKELITGINTLLDKMPKNCVTARRDELQYRQLCFNAGYLYQENSILLSAFVLKFCELLTALEISPSAPDPIQALPPKKEVENPAHSLQKAKKPKNAVSKRFDKYSIRGLIGAVIGGAAMAVISSTMADRDPANIGAMLSSWAAGALMALVILADYSFLAKKIDIFGTVACSIVTLLSCLFCSIFGILRIMTNTAKTLDASVTFSDTARNWTAYTLLFPDVPNYFSTLLLKNIFMAAVASGLFYVFYFRRHRSIMYSDGSDLLLPEDSKKDKKKKNML